MFARPLFRVLAAVIFIMCAGAIILSIINITTMWNYNALNSWGVGIWSVFAGFHFLLIWIATIAFFVVISGKPPKYLIRLSKKLQ